MRLNKPRIQRERARRSRRRVVLALAGLATAGALALGGGARAQRMAAVESPSLETLLRQRDAAEVAPAPPAPSLDELRDRHRELRQRRVDIEGSLPPLLRTPRSRRPRLKKPQRDLVDREGGQDLDADADNPDRLAFQVRR